MQGAVKNSRVGRVRSRRRSPIGSCTENRLLHGRGMNRHARASQNLKPLHRLKPLYYTCNKGLSVLLDHLVTHLRADVGRYRANVTGTLWLRVLLDSAAQPQAHVVLLENSSTATSARCVTRKQQHSHKCTRIQGHVKQQVM